MAEGITPENRHLYQAPNHITNVQQFMINEQYMRDIIAVIEKSVAQNGRALSKVEAKVLNLGKGITDNYNKISQDLKSSGRTNVNKNEAQILKSSLDDLFKEMRHLIQPKKSGTGRNERTDTSWAEVARLGQLFADNITNNMERITSVMNNITSFQNESISILQQAQQLKIISAQVSQTPPSSSVTPPGNNPPTTMWWNTNLFRKYGIKPSGNSPTPINPHLLPKGDSSSILQHKFDLYRAKMLPSIKAPSSSVFTHYFDEMMGNFFGPLHKAFGSVPVVGKVTGASAKIADAYTSGGKAGEVLAKAAPRIFPKKLFGGAGLKIAGLAKFLGPTGAIAAGIGLIFGQMKKSSPVLQAVTSLFELAWNLLWMPLGNALGTLLLPMAEDLINFAISFNELFTDFSMEKLGEVMYGALQFIWGALYDISNAIPTMIIDGFLDMLSGLFTTLGWDKAAETIDDFKSIVSQSRDFMRNLPTKIWDILKGAWQKVFDFFNDPVGNITKAFNNLGQIIADAFKGIINGGGDLLDSLNPHWFATGGIVTGPTLGVVGEAGPEAVVPLDKANGIGTTYVININGDVYGVSDLESRIERAIQRTANKAYYR